MTDTKEFPIYRLVFESQKLSRHSESGDNEFNFMAFKSLIFVITKSFHSGFTYLNFNLI